MKTQAFFENIQQIISSELLKSKKSIYVAVAWFTDISLLKILEDKAKQGIKVKILFVADDINNQSGIGFSNLESLGGKVFPLDSNELLMHNKFCIIDNETVITGSYNWTNKAANNNLENVMLITGNFEVCEQYQNNFNKILSEYFDEDFSHEYHSRGKSNWLKYKFYNKEYTNFKELSIAFSENLIKWKDAQEHFKQGFIQQWLEEINDFDTIIQLNKAKSKTSDFECQLAFINYFTQQNKTFSLFGIDLDLKLNGILALLQKYNENETTDEKIYILEYIKNGKLADIYEMYLLYQNKDQDNFYKSLRFAGNEHYDSFDIIFKSNKALTRYFEWEHDSSKFIPIDSIYFRDIEYYLMKNKEVDDIKNKFYVPQIIIDNIYSSKKEDIIKAVELLKRIPECPIMEKEKVETFFNDYILPIDFFQYYNNIVWKENNVYYFETVVETKSFKGYTVFKSYDGRLLPKDESQYENKDYFNSIKNKLSECKIEAYNQYASQLLLSFTNKNATPYLIPYRKWDKWGFCDRNKNIVIQCEYDEVSFFSEGLAWVKTDGKKGFINEVGKQIIPCDYNDVGYFSEGLAWVEKNTDKGYKKGFIDKTGIEVIPCIYDETEPYENGLAWVRKKWQFGYIDSNGVVVIPFEHDCIDKNGRFHPNYQELLNKKQQNMKESYDLRYDNSILKKYGFCGLYDEDTDEFYRFSKGLIKVRVGNYGYIDLDGIEYWENNSDFKNIIVSHQN